jgi:hypothetical protein
MFDDRHIAPTSKGSGEASAIDPRRANDGFADTS